MNYYEGEKVLVIIPAWNESETIENTLNSVNTAFPKFDVLVVDDASNDNTAKIAKNQGAKVLELPYNMGIGGAMRLGFKYALRKNYYCAVKIDADGQHDPAEMGNVLNGLENADISIGARFAGKGDYKASGPRWWAMLFLSRVISWMAKTRLTDVTSGFRAANRSAIAQYVQYYPTQYMSDAIDSFVVALKSGCTATQVPVAMLPRQGGQPSNGPIKSAIYLLRSLSVLGFAIFSKGNK